MIFFKLTKKEEAYNYIAIFKNLKNAADWSNPAHKQKISDTCILNSFKMMLVEAIP